MKYQPKTYFISDLHFSHTNVIKYDNRPYQTVEQMDKDLINKWNSTVKDEDTVYVLGDFGFMGIGKIKEILDKLKGIKILILGNHDRHKPSAYKRAGFSFVAHEITTKFGGVMFKLSHYPYRESKLKQWWEMFRFKKDYTFINRKRPLKGIEEYLLHGHTHSGSVKINRKKKQIHCGCWLWGYKPASLDEILSLIKED